MGIVCHHQAQGRDAGRGFWAQLSQRPSSRITHRVVWIQEGSGQLFPLADAAATLIPLLHLAFQNQRLKKGATSLELAELNDNYGKDDEHTQKPPWGYTDQGPRHE